MKCYAEQQNLTEPAEGNSGLRPFCIATSAGFFIGDKVKRIPLTQGQFTIVNDKDYEWLSRHKWLAVWNKSTQSFYAARYSKRVNGRQNYISMAREILGLFRGDKRQADHIDHITLNNQQTNLRICTAIENKRNSLPYKNCSSKYKGVHKLANNKWQAYIRINHKKRHLGLFDNEFDAAKQYDRIAKKHFGEFAFLNF